MNKILGIRGIKAYKMEGRRHLTTFYRPHTFSQLKGQEHVKKVLSNSVEKKIIGKAYLFSGTRGVGKTTVARIFAKAINCKNRQGAEPCNRCDICKEITNGTSLDVLEIDGASHTGVDNVRKLIEDISLVPIRCKYRVVIIDEVHMLSKAAFNALLKTIEEPPPHVVFILATTEVQKIPSTIISRCQHFVFKKLTQRELVEHLKDILNKEGISYEDEALHLIAKKGGGSVRDCLSILSQVISIEDEKITERLVRDILGIASSDIIKRLMFHISENDVTKVVNIVKELLDQGIDIQYFLYEFTNVWRNLFLIKASDAQIILSEDKILTIEDLKDIADKFSISQIHSGWQIVQEALEKIDKTYDPALFLELLFVNLANLKYLIPIEDYDLVSTTKTKKQTHDNIDLKAQESQLLSTEKKDKKGEKNPTWEGFLEFLHKKKVVKKIPHLSACKGEIIDNRLIIKCRSYWLDRLNASKESRNIFEKGIKEYFGDIQYEFVVEKKIDHNTLKEKILNDPNINLIIKEFNAKVVEIKERDNQKEEHKER